MNVFDELEEIYSDINNAYVASEIQSRSKGHHRKEQNYHRKRNLNDHAYFLFMFSRLEDRIKNLSNDLIDYKYNNLTNWSNKRTWDILYKRKKKSINFLDRVALLTELDGGDYNLINRYYDLRNKIAHG